MSEVVDIAQEIRAVMSEMRQALKEVQFLAVEKARTLADYDKAVGLTMIKLKNGIPFVLEGQTIRNPTSTASDKISRAICFSEKIYSEEASALYNAKATEVRALQAILNGYQSLFSHLTNI